MLSWLAKGTPSAVSLEGAEIWVDGFHGFTPSEYAVLEALLRKTKRVNVALCLDRPYGAGERPDELELFHPTAETSSQLCELAQSAGTKLESPVLIHPVIAPRFERNPLLAFLESNWSNRVRWNGDVSLLRPDHPDCGLSLHAAANRRGTEKRKPWRGICGFASGSKEEDGGIWPSS